MRDVEIGNCTLIHADCMDVMKDMQDKAFDLAIVDPPYGVGGENNTGRISVGAGKLKNRAIQNHSTQWDIAPPSKYFETLFRVSKEQIIWGGNYFGLPRNRGFIVWDKVQPWPNFSAAEYAWQSHDVPSKIFKFDNRTGDKIHPTQKPIELYAWLLTNYTEPGKTILDTHLGSGSSAIAANKLGFKFTGIEIDEDYFNAAVKRISEAYQQTSLFDETVIQQPDYEQTEVFA